MRILHVITRSEWGGAQNVVCQLAEAQHKKGHMVEVMCGEQGRLVRELQKVGVPVRFNQHLQRNLSCKDLWAAIYLWRVCGEKFDLIHAHSSKAGVFARLVGWLRGIPVCFTVHGFGVSPNHPKWKQGLYFWVERWLAWLTDALIFVSNADEARARSQGWLDKAKYSTVIFNGVRSSEEKIPELEQTMSWKNMSRKKLGIPCDAYVVGNLARVVWVKNPEFWQAVAEQFLEEDQEGYFIWFGGGDDDTSLHRATKGSYEERICFWGETENIDLALLGMDVLFLSSRSEGMPLAVLEGMSRKKAILAPALAGLSEMLKGECGLTYAPENVEQAVAALHRLKNQAERQRLAQNGYAKYLQVYTEERMVHKYMEVYQRVRTSIKEH